MKVGQKYRVTIDDYDINGYGVCKIESKVTFVIGGLVGEDCLVEIVNLHKSYAFANVLTIYKESEY